MGKRVAADAMVRGQKRPQNSEIGPTESYNTSGNKRERQNNLSFVEERCHNEEEEEQSFNSVY